MSNITLNIVEPGSSTPVEPVVPNTGLFTHGIGGTEATIIAITSAVLLLTIVAVVVAMLYKKHKKQGKATKLVSTVDACATVVKSKKRVSAGLAAIALLVSAGTFIALAKNAVNATESDEQTSQAEDDDSSLTVDVSSEELTIEVGDEPVFAVLPVKVSVEEATQAGYTLTAYAEDTNLVSTTNPDNTIPMIAVDEANLSENELATLVPLTDNTYGLALGEEPTSKDAEVYTSLSADSSNPTIIKSMTEYTPTAENDTTTIYYGFYITPDIPYGTYTNDGEVYYNATINTTLVTFDGKGLYFNDDEQQTTNTVEYIAVSQEGSGTETSSTINQIISGEYKEPSQALPYNFLGWSEEQEATTPTYTSAEDIAQNLPILPNQPIILYAIWQKATIITFDSNDGAGDKTTQTIIAGESDNLNSNEFTREGYTFTGWNTVATPTEQEPGKTYADQAEYTAPQNISQNLTLYAQWEEDILYMQDVATWGSSLSKGNEITVVDSRDGTEYTVARLADNNIWMTQNLDHNIVSTPNFYTYENTDIGHGTIPDPTATWTGTATYPTGTTTWNSSTTAPESYDPGDLYWDGTLDTSWSGNLSNETVTDPPATGGTHYHIGNYYNWTAAVAMSDSSAYGDEQSGTDVNQSICPAGWRLPNLSENKSYQSLVSAENLSAGTRGNIQNSPVYFVYGGYWYGSSGGVGSCGYYWSSVVGSSDNAYLLVFFVNGNLDPQDYGGRGHGYSLRCVAR